MSKVKNNYLYRENLRDQNKANDSSNLPWHKEGWDELSKEKQTLIEINYPVDQNKNRKVGYKSHRWNYFMGLSQEQFYDDHALEGLLSEKAKASLKESYQKIKVEFYKNNKWSQSSFRDFVNKKESRRKYFDIWFAKSIMCDAIKYHLIKGRIHEVFLKYLTDYFENLNSDYPEEFKSYFPELKISVAEREEFIKVMKYLRKKKVIVIGKKKLAIFLYHFFDTGYAKDSLIDKIRKGI